MTKLLEKLFFEYDFQAADLTIFDRNKAGIKCYENVGFEINPAIVYNHNNDGGVWTVLNMTIEKKN